MPAELVRSTVLLARRFGPRRQSLSVYSPVSRLPRTESRDAGSGLRALERPAAQLRQGRRLVTWLLLSIAGLLDVRRSVPGRHEPAEVSRGILGPLGARS